MPERFRPPLTEAVQVARPEPEVVLSPTDEKLNQAVKMLEAGVDSIMTSEGFQEYLKTQARFHTYSYNNTLLIMGQKPDSTNVAGFRRWQSMGRQVRAGERAIKVFVPHLKAETDPTTGDKTERLVGFGLGNVFDVSQTDGKPLPEPPRAIELRESSEAGRLLFGYTQDWLARHSIPVFQVNRVASSPHAMGVWNPGERSISVVSRLSDNQKAKTLLHETAHFVLDSKFSDSRADHEAIAESTAFVVTNHFGIDTGDYSFAYVAGWAKNRDVFKRNLNAIQKTSKAIIEGIEGRQIAS